MTEETVHVLPTDISGTGTEPAQQDLERPPFITICCTEPGCHTEFFGNLSQWWRVYTSGEIWHETCPGCGQQFVARLAFRHVRRRHV